MEAYQYEDLPSPPPGFFRIAEILPREEHEPVSCFLHHTNWSTPLVYEALSYAWGDKTAKATIICHGKKVEVT